jgi:sugar lactone lactonase YvrE
VNRYAIGSLALGLVVLVGTVAEAVTTRSWNVNTYKDFDEGDGKDVLISSLGEVTPGRSLERTAIEGDALWSAVRGDDGTIYAGTIEKGTILAISGGKSRVLASLEKDTPWIGSLLLSGSTLYVGTVASGSIHTVDVKSGKTALFAKLEGTDHVWAMTLSADGKTLYAATGSEGKLFAVDLASKKASVAWDSDETHLLSMTRAKDGAIWLGSADEAILYRFDPKTGQARAVADFAGSEIKAVAEVDGAIVCAVNDFDAKSGTAPPKKPAPKGTAAKPPETGTPGAEKVTDVAARPGERKGRGAIFRVEADGRVEQLHALADGYLQSIAVAPEGVYAAAGTGGRVYLIKDDRTVLTVFNVDERQVNAIVAGKSGVAFVTGDSAAAYVASGAPKAAAYTSKVLDAGFPARWGNLRFRGEGELSVETRSGNTAKPDKGWSGWQKVSGVSKAGGDASTGQIGSPQGRYLQFKVGFGGAGTLRQVSLYYLPQNQRARLTDITVGDADLGSKPAVTTAAGAAKPRSPIVKVKWKVENPDADELAYTLEMRPEGDTVWRPVPTSTGSDPYTKTDFDWNTEALPDGLYRLRVTATDGRSNPPEQALAHQLVSTPFLIDNQKPQVSGLEVRYPNAAARAVDSFSRIDEIAYAVDGGDWMMAYPKDGIFDSVSEAFSLKLPDGLAPGLHTLSVRVADEADNIGAASITFRIGK